MTGPEHYAEAERILAATMREDVQWQEGFSGWTRSELERLAQVHATLALADAARRGFYDVTKVTHQATRSADRRHGERQS